MPYSTPCSSRHQLDTAAVFGQSKADYVGVYTQVASVPLPHPVDAAVTPSTYADKKLIENIKVAGEANPGSVANGEAVGVILEQLNAGRPVAHDAVIIDNVAVSFVAGQGYEAEIMLELGRAGYRIDIVALRHHIGPPRPEIPLGYVVDAAVFADIAVGGADKHYGAVIAVIADIEAGNRFVVIKGGQGAVAHSVKNLAAVIGLINMAAVGEIHGLGVNAGADDIGYYPPLVVGLGPAAPLIGGLHQKLCGAFKLSGIKGAAGRQAQVLYVRARSQPPPPQPALGGYPDLRPLQYIWLGGGGEG
ncbi:hypothetical protein ES703_25769 [subsurface metagenome]